MNLVFGSDHAGFALKRFLLSKMEEQGHKCVDVGAETDACAASYVPAAVLAAEKIKAGEADYAVLICGTGIGISIAANKEDGIRCGLCNNEYMARMSRQHNNANAIAMGARVVGTALGLSMLEAFLSESFEDGGRHSVRVNEIMDLENRN